MANTHTGVYISTGVTDEGLRTQLHPWRDTRLLDLRNVVLGTFGGCTTPNIAAAIDARVFPLLEDRKWCCSGEQPAPVQQLEWAYRLPPRLAALSPVPGILVNADVRALVPLYERPAFCDDIAADKHNAQFLAFDNHPCTFLSRGIHLPATVDELLG